MPNLIKQEDINIVKNINAKNIINLAKQVVFKGDDILSFIDKNVSLPVNPNLPYIEDTALLNMTTQCLDKYLEEFNKVVKLIGLFRKTTLVQDSMLTFKDPAYQYYNMFNLSYFFKTKLYDVYLRTDELMMELDYLVHPGAEYLFPQSLIDEAQREANELYGLPYMGVQHMFLTRELRSSIYKENKQIIQGLKEFVYLNTHYMLGER